MKLNFDISKVAYSQSIVTVNRNVKYLLPFSWFTRLQSSRAEMILLK